MVYRYSPHYPPHISCVGLSLQAFGQASATTAVAAPTAVLLLGAADEPSGVATGFSNTTTPPTNISHVASPAVETLAGDATDPAAVRRVGGGGGEMETRSKRQKPVWEVEEERGWAPALLRGGGVAVVRGDR